MSVAEPQPKPDNLGTLDFSDQQLRPLMAHDGFTFDQLQNAYNYRNISERRLVFAKMIVDQLKSIPSETTVLDIGCGRGIARDNLWQWAIRPYANQYWGIEPDPSVVPDTGLFDQTQTALMEPAKLPECSIDVAYSWMVMEHVEKPVEFCESLYRALKPGGTYFFATPNAKHYFTIVAKLCKNLSVDERVLSLIRKQDDLDEYHYPVQYKFNSEPMVAQAAKQSGFAEPDFLYLETEGPVKYFPGPTKPLYHALAWKRKKMKRADILLTMIGRLTKPK
jgi:SAM-dependent methyltransferase